MIFQDRIRTLNPRRRGLSADDPAYEAVMPRDHDRAAAHAATARAELLADADCAGHAAALSRSAYLADRSNAVNIGRALA